MTAAIGIDLGTSGARAALVDGGGKLIALGRAPIAPAARRAPEAWWQAVTAALHDLGATASLAAVRAIAVDGTSGTVLGLDPAAAPCGEAWLYNDPAPAAMIALVEATAPPDSLARGATSPLAKALDLTHRGAARVVHQADFILGRLCGEFGVTDENNALKTGYDPVSRRWPDWIRGLTLPSVVAPGTPIAPITRAAATALGLPPDAMLVAGTTDGCAAFIATGASELGAAVTSLGTTLTLKLLSDAPVFAPAYGVYSHRLGARFLVGGASNSGGGVLGQYFDREALRDLSAQINPRQPSGLDYYPLSIAGERFPVADPRLPPRLTPRPPEDWRFLQGMLEGIAAIEARGYRLLRSLGAPQLSSVRSVGGGAGNPAWSAIRARMLGLPMQPPDAEEAAVGAARLALQGLGLQGLGG
jgi:sugar (pentulose or hexulose) kinase